jgi:NAD(P)-dependent dehydrogenase (short-subunit alcohol dehydrogenase family)
MSGRRFENKIAVVTGAGQGIGEAYARALAAEGAAVVIAEIDAERGGGAKEISDRGRRFIARRRRERYRPALAEAARGLRRRRLPGQQRRDLRERDSVTAHSRLELLRALHGVNMTGALLVTRAVVPLMVARGGGAIVNQSSAAAWMGAGFYGIAKLALHGITQSLARELGPRGIRVNAIAPGPVDTEATRGIVPEAILKGSADACRSRASGTTDDVVGACLFLPLPLRRGARWITRRSWPSTAADHARVRRVELTEQALPDPA